MRIVAQIKTDIAFQVKHGFYLAYFIIAIIYIIFLRFIPLDWKETGAILLIFSDCSFLGSFFIGGIILLEKDQGMIDQLLISPLRISEYILSKALSLSCLATLASFVILFASFGPSLPYTSILLAVFGCSLFATFLGMMIAINAKSVNQYLLITPLFVPIFFLPLANYFSLPAPSFLEWTPSYSTLQLISGFHSISDLAFHLFILSSWIFLFFFLVKYHYERILSKKAGV
ncbi:ABC transporter permease [Pseudalkalibacillus hwajinpoensis]|uniref:fluoroquinolone export ABC transporter permease subunit n=1 Tax=Guptibacillus hwajinpoensis TaxID=208199 RepID=UPI001CFC616F